MGTVAISFSMSLDGFIAGPHDEVDRLFQWYFVGQTVRTVSAGNQDFEMGTAAADRVEAASRAIGVLVTGRRTFDISGAWGGKHPLNVPIVVVTHRVPAEWDQPGSPFTFITDGVASAIRAAQKIAGDKGIAVGAPSIAQQCLQAGLIDEINIDLVPVLLVEGLRLFDHLGSAKIELAASEVSLGTGITHLLYRVLK